MYQYRRYSPGVVARVVHWICEDHDVLDALSLIVASLTIVWAIIATVGMVVKSC